MIPVSGEPHASEFRSSLREYILKELRDQLPSDGENLEEVSRALAASLESTSRAEGMDASSITHPILSLYLARGLWSIGQHDVSLQYLCRTQGRGRSHRWAEYVQSCLPMNAQLVRLLSGGVLKPMRSDLQIHQLAWLLDLTAIAPSVDLVLELVRFAVLRNVLHECASLFDNRSGRGMIWLKAGDIWGGSNSSDGSEQDLLQAATDCLQGERKSRGWAEVPHILFAP